MLEFFKKYLVYISLILVVLAFGAKIFLIRSNDFSIDVSKVNLYFFYGEGCPHCAKEEELLNDLEKKYSQIKVHRFETWYNTENASLLDKVRGDLKFKTGVPVLIMGNESIVGYSDYETSGKKIEGKISEYVKNGCADIMAPYLEKNQLAKKETQDKKNGTSSCSADLEKKEGAENFIKLPILGMVDLRNLTMPVLTVIIAAADGFNPCAMWVLLFLISMLIDMNDRKRMWVLGSTFIISSALVYYVFVFSWLQVFVSIGFIIWVRLLIGLVAVGTGTYHLKEYWENIDGTCKVTDEEKRRKMFLKVKEIVKRKSLLLAVLGVVLLAAAVNLIELLCSAGFPQAFTQVLALKHFPFWKNQLYILLYIVVFVMNDIVVFFLAMKSMQLQGFSTKFSRWSSLIGGVLILILGILLMFKPQWIMFG